MSPRNVMLVSDSDSYTDADVRVVIIDFNVSNVLGLSARSYGDPDLDAIHKKWPGRMVGPITRFWDALMEFEARDWVADNEGAANEWLWECFGDRKEYVPVIREEGREDDCLRLSRGGEDEDEVVFRGRDM